MITSMSVGIGCLSGSIRNSAIRPFSVSERFATLPTGTPR